MDEKYYAPIITFVNTEYGVMRVGIMVPPAAYAALNNDIREVWQDYLRLLDEQVQDNMRELSKGEHPQD
jgi:hypothetical protein